MLRVLLCITCCSAPPPNNRPVKRTAGSSQLKNGVTSNESADRDLTEKESSEAEKINQQLLTDKLQADNENYGTKDDHSQGKLTPPISDTNKSILEGSDSVTAGIQAKLQRSDAVDHDDSSDRHGESGAEPSNCQEDRSGLLLSSVEIEPFGESVSTSTSHHVGDHCGKMSNLNDLGLHNPEPSTKSFENTCGNDRWTDSNQFYESLLESGSATKNAPSTTKIGDYARIEYSPLEDLESVTTMSYSRRSSEKDRSHSQAGSTLDRKNSLTTDTYDGLNSRRSSQGGIESTSISIASQLSNEQFQQNLTNMLESVNSYYQTTGVIGLPLGPGIDGVLSETTKTSPETPGAALTSTSQDSLSDAAVIDIRQPASRPLNERSNISPGAALVGDSVERGDLVEEMAGFTQPAPLAMGEDQDQPYTIQANSNTANSILNPASRVGSPLSIATTNSGGLTNPTPTPSELSSGSSKKKRLGAKALLKKLRPSSKKKNKDGLN
jgi:hypothetical protein